MALWSLNFRHVLAAVHFNCNLRRDTKKKADGSEQLRVVYPKFKNGEASVRGVRIEQNFGELFFILTLSAAPISVYKFLLLVSIPFYWVPVGRTCLYIKTVHLWWSFPLILMTCMFYNALIWWREIWCWSSLGLKGSRNRSLKATWQPVLWNKICMEFNSCYVSW